jgi:hypothetical protein
VGISEQSRKWTPDELPADPRGGYPVGP